MRRLPVPLTLFLALAMPAAAQEAPAPAAPTPIKAGEWLKGYEGYFLPFTGMHRPKKRVVAFSLAVDAQGVPAGCTILDSSGVEEMDALVCRLMRQLARFEPARDAQGNAVPSTWESKFRASNY
ncbi:energy transducer TonB [Sphingomonas canadensis]|uniref:Energy transducer TonB n=1 Tax=Sphingomonas canadensis TaxID=1219257 RepID=A0ABW3H6I5_9SPHN|nr:energy transducer TonB [Sphingomonas canadensis]MCW3836452.1 energy transducer TonB [Sphingomonas canadensis]